MPSTNQKPPTIEQYITGAPEEVRPRLKQLHECIRKAAPGVTESLKWSMPAYSCNRILVTLAVFKDHVGFYPTPSVIKAFAKDIKKNLLRVWCSFLILRNCRYH